MATPVKVSGTTGSVTIPAAAGGIAGTPTTGLVFRWNGRFEREVKDVTTFDDSGSARVKRGGMMSVTGTCDAYFNATMPGIDSSQPVGVTSGVGDADGGGVAGFVLQAFTGRTYTFPAITRTIRHNIEKTGDSIVTMTFQSSWLTGADDVIVEA